ncbi:unnamed protein product [Arctogadus glacialis]
MTRKSLRGRINVACEAMKTKLKQALSCIDYVATTTVAGQPIILASSASPTIGLMRSASRGVPLPLHVDP